MRISTLAAVINVGAFAITMYTVGMAKIGIVLYAACWIAICLLLDLFKATA